VLFAPLIRRWDEDTIVYYPFDVIGKGLLYRARDRDWVNRYHYFRMGLVIAALYFIGFGELLTVALLLLLLCVDVALVRTVRWKVIGVAPRIPVAQHVAEIARATSGKVARASLLMACFAVTVSALAFVTAIAGEDGEVIASTLIWLAFSVSIAILTARVLAVRRRLDRIKSL
jgi:hypothetical protein